MSGRNNSRLGNNRNGNRNGDEAKVKVNVGDQVAVKWVEDGTEESFRIDPHDSDPARGIISVKTPVGQALHGHSVNEKVTVHLPVGSEDLVILRIIKSGQGEKKVSH